VNVSYKTENNKLVIAITGQVDSTNAPEMEEKIRAIVAEHPSDSIVLDLDKLEYTTSAGLRVILRVKDDCIPFNPAERQDIYDPKDRMKGVGIRMVYKGAKDVKYQNILGLNVLTIRI